MMPIGEQIRRRPGGGPEAGGVEAQGRVSRPRDRGERMKRVERSRRGAGEGEVSGCLLCSAVPPVFGRGARPPCPRSGKEWCRGPCWRSGLSRAVAPNKSAMARAAKSGNTGRLRGRPGSVMRPYVPQDDAAFASPPRTHASHGPVPRSWRTPEEVGRDATTMIRGAHPLSMISRRPDPDRSFPQMRSRPHPDDLGALGRHVLARRAATVGPVVALRDQ